MDWGRRWLGARIALLVIGLLGVVGLTACTGEDPEPGLTPTATAPTTSAATPTPTLTPTPPVAPKAEATAKSAEAFVKYFWEVYNYSYQTLDPSLLQQISGPKCIFCSDTVRAINTLNSKKQVVLGSEIELNVAVAPPVNPQDGLIVATTVSERPGRILTADGQTVSKTNGIRDMTSEIALDWSKKSWVVRDLANDEKSGKSW